MSRSTTRPAGRQLSTADARREAVLAVAESVVAERGFAATPTAAIAQAAGISHAYLFRLFPTKAELTLAVVRRCNERLREAAAAGLRPDRDLLILHLHSIVAAISDEAVRNEMRTFFTPAESDATRACLLAEAMLSAVVAPVP